MVKNISVIFIALVIVFLLVIFFLSQNSNSFLSEQKQNHYVNEFANTGNQKLPVQNKDFAPIKEKTENNLFYGYYETKEKESWGNRLVCDTFVVLDGPQDVVQKFKDLIKKGNTVQELTSDGHLRINLPWNEIDEESKKIIKNSNKQNPVTIKLKEKELGLGMGVGACFSFFEFMEVAN